MLCVGQRPCQVFSVDAVCHIRIAFDVVYEVALDGEGAACGLQQDGFVGFDITNIEVEAGVTGRAAYNGGDVVNYGFVDVVAVYEDGKSLDALVVDGLQILDTGYLQIVIGAVGIFLGTFGGDEY